jgi:hypothetical protein
MFWNVEAVNRSSNCNPGSQTVWFEKSLPVGQRKSISNSRIFAQTRSSRTVSTGQANGRTSAWESAEQANVSVSVLIWGDLVKIQVEIQVEPG